MIGRRSISSVSAVVAGRLCQGCGACSYVCPGAAIELRNLVQIGIRPVVDAANCTGCGDCIKVCSGIQLSHDHSTWSARVLDELSQEWGPVLELWEGHASDEQIRYAGGSGGAATALSLYCLEREGMHGALHVRMDPERPYLNQTVMSKDRVQLLEGTGSRYAPAAVCAELGLIQQAPAPCVLIGKPCDIAAATKAAAIRPDLKSRLGLTISIFCGGTPSTKGTFEVLRQLGINVDDVADLRYRGHGWPGMTGVNLRSSPDGQRVEMTYARAWDTILTKHKPFRCHICPDGTGEFADIACGDPWYRPIKQGEHGSTLIVVRSERGREILRKAIQAGYIVAEPRAAEILVQSQNGLLMRRRHVFPKVLALWLFRLPIPRYLGFTLGWGWRRLFWRRQVISLFRALRHALHFRRKGALRLHPGDVISSSVSVSETTA